MAFYVRSCILLCYSTYCSSAIPITNIQPSTPSVHERDDSGYTSLIIAAMMRPYHEALEEEAAEARNRAEAETAERLGLPVV